MEWSNAQSRLLAEFGCDAYSAFLSSMALQSIDGDAAMVSVPSKFLQSWIKRPAYSDAICKALGVATIKISVRQMVPAPLAPPPPPPPQVEIAAPSPAPEDERAWSRPIVSCWRPSISNIIRYVCVRYGIGREPMLSALRKLDLVRPRQRAMFICKALDAGRSYPEIGRRFGGRDHTTVLHALKAVAKLAAADEYFRADLEDCFFDLTGRADIPTIPTKEEAYAQRGIAYCHRDFGCEGPGQARLVHLADQGQGICPEATQGLDQGQAHRDLADVRAA